MTSSSVGKDVKVEKSKVCEWVKLPTPFTTHTHPSLVGADESPDTAPPVVWGCGIEEGCGDADAGTEADAGAGTEEEEAQLPKAAWHPVWQYDSEFPLNVSKGSHHDRLGKRILTTPSSSGAATSSV